jgi:phosphoserine phosphatase
VPLQKHDEWRNRFSESFKKRMVLLEGLSEEVLQTVAENLPITKALIA